MRRIFSLIQKFKSEHPGLYSAAIFIILSALLVFILLPGINNLNYRWQWYRIDDYIIKTDISGIHPGPLLQGLGITILISAASLVLAVIFGFISALFRLSDSFTARISSRIYIEAVRNTPLLIQLFMMYFVVAPVLGMDRIFTAVLTLSLFEGAYTSEIIRSGILAIEKGQWEAGYSLAMTKTSVYRYIILPQTIPKIMPVIAGQLISLIKDSALVSTIAIYELTMQGQVIIAETFLTFEIWFTVAAGYLILNTGLSLLLKKFEKQIGGFK